jgi:glycosyltransferase involved in cell wall biosynthesis
MRVLFLQQQPCCRALKYAAALRTSGPSGLRLGFCFRGRSLSELYGTGNEFFDSWWRLDGDLPAGLGKALAEFRPDVIHSHNLPDSLTVLALELADGAIPVVHDVHDLQSLRRTPYEDGFPEPDDPLALERRAVEGCSAVVTVSQELLTEIQSRHRLPARTLVFPNLALGRDVPTTVPAKRPSEGAPRLVYQGTLSSNGGHYDLRDLFAAIAAQGIELHVYPGRQVERYDALDGVHLHETLTPPELMQELPRYDLGWAGFNSTLNARHLDTALPNKVFEYLSCGLPVVTLRHRALSHFLDEMGLGVSLPSVDDLSGTLEALDLEALRERVAAVRTEFTFESRIDELVALYETLTP